MESISRLFHKVADYFISCIRLCQNREVGWMTWDRQSGDFKREQQSLWKKFKLLALFNPLTEWIDTTHALRLWMHEKTMESGKDEATEASQRQIRSFVDFFHINMDDFDPSDISQYRTFNEFFTRKHAAGSRPIHEPSDPSEAVVSADCRLVVYPTVSRTRSLWVKGRGFTMASLVQDEERATPWHDGSVAIFRLSPQDYHRYHSPVEGKVKWYKRIPGDYYQVDPVALHSDVDILSRNARCCVCIESEEFGDVLFVAIGATDVGDVEINKEIQRPGTMVQKGDEIGLFQFGGSSIVVAFEDGSIKFDEDLDSMSKRQIMVDVQVGMSMGRATRGGLQ